MFTYEEIAAAFEYDPVTGIVKRKPYKGVRGIPTPTKRGRTEYITFKYKGKGLSAHRVAWMLMFKEWPKQDIGHDDGNRSNNKIENLSVMSEAENSRNRRMMVTNKSGFNGVFWRKDRRVWIAQITVDYRIIYLGYFKSLDDAVAARKEAEVKYGFHPNHGREA